MKGLGRYKKAIVAAVVAAAVTILAVADGTVDPDEAATIVAAWGGVFGVYRASNDPPAGL